ncbi:MAG: diguanylate cyclase [Gammaproteobacteria bacterium]|jgi:diguanylate cyclase (GGDEF)-like protein
MPPDSTPAIPKEEILDQLDAVVIVADMETYEILYANAYARENFGVEPGTVRAELLKQDGGDGPCSFCSPKERLLDENGEPGAPVRNEFKNTEDGRWYLIVEKAIRWTGGRLARMQISLDISQQKARERVMAYHASHDAMTGLLNRTHMQTLLEKTHAQSHRSGRPYSLILIDLDHFKRVNDNFGHQIGDAVLKEVTKTIRSGNREGDAMSRWGGEEFLCLLPDTDAQQATLIAERFRRRVENAPLETRWRDINITISAGVASYPQDSEHLSRLINLVDSALYEAKRSGRNKVVHMGPSPSGEMTIVGQLDRAIRKEEILTAFQPIVKLATEEKVGYECYARIRTAKGEIMPAEQFIHAAHQLHLATEVDYRVIGTAIKRIAQTPKDGRELRFFLSFSHQLVEHGEMIEKLAQQIAEARELGYGNLVLELDADRNSADSHRIRQGLAPLIDLDVKFAMHTFSGRAAGYEYLSDLPVDYIKIEGGLVSRVLFDRRARSIVTSLKRLADEIGIVSIAEMVEDAKTADALHELGVDWAQGYYYGKPSHE